MQNNLFSGLSHEAIARLLAERYADKERKILTLLVKEQKLTSRAIGLTVLHFVP